MPWCSQLWAIWGKEVSCASAYAQAAPAPEAPPGAGLPVALLLSGQACLRPSCYGGCLSPTRSQAVEGPSPGLVHCPLCQTYPEPAPRPGSQHLLGPGARYSLALHLPTAPKVPRHPTSRTEPASFALPAHCAQDPTPLRQALPPAAAGRRLRTSTRHSPQWRPSCAALWLYLGKLWAEFQRSVSLKCIRISCAPPT